MIGDMNKERLAHGKVGFEPIDLTAHDRLGISLSSAYDKKTERSRLRSPKAD